MKQASRVLAWNMSAPGMFSLNILESSICLEKIDIWPSFFGCRQTVKKSESTSVERDCSWLVTAKQLWVLFDLKYLWNIFVSEFVFFFGGGGEGCCCCWFLDVARHQSVFLNVEQAWTDMLGSGKSGQGSWKFWPFLMTFFVSLKVCLYCFSLIVCLNAVSPLLLCSY